MCRLSIDGRRFIFMEINKQISFSKIFDAIVKPMSSKQLTFASNFLIKFVTKVKKLFQQHLGLFFMSGVQKKFDEHFRRNAIQLGQHSDLLIQYRYF